MDSMALSFGLVNPNSADAVSRGNYKYWSALNEDMFGEDANMINAWLAERANYFNVQQQERANAWNLEQWNRENEYNSPSAQMQRFVEAGINPIFALKGADSGNAQQLTSSSPHPAVVSNMTYDPQRLANEMLQFTESNGLNAMLGLGELDLKNRNYYLTARRTKSDIKKTQAETDLLKSQLESNEFVNKVNLSTFSTQVNLKIEELNQVRQSIKNLKAEESLTDAQKSLLSVTEQKEKALKLQIEAATDKVKSETFDLLDNLRYRWYEAVTARMSAEASGKSAEAAIQMANTADKALSHQIEKDTKDFEKLTNDQILHIIDSQRGWLDRFLGTPFNVVSGMFGTKDNMLIDRVIGTVQSAANVLYNRFYNNPTQTNEKALKDMQGRIKEFQKLKIPLPVVSPGSSVLNPSQ